MDCRLLLSCLFTLTSTCVAVQDAPGTLTVATYNVENLFDNDDDPYTPDEETAPKSAADLAVLGATIDRLDADVLALEEVENLGVLNRLNLLLQKPYPFVEILPGNDRRGIHCALLSRVRILRSMGHRYWALAGGRRFARDLPVFELVPSPGRRLLVAPVHFKSKRTYGEDVRGIRWRTAEAAGVLGVLEDLRARGFTAPFVLLGDLNDERSSAPLAPLFARLHDATSGVPGAQRYSYVYHGSRQQIDHILWDGDLSPMTARFVHEEDQASDHAPLVVRFAWPARVSRTAGPGRQRFVAARVPQVAATDTRRLRRLLLHEVAVTGRVRSVDPTRRGGHYNIRFGDGMEDAVTGFVPREAAARFGNVERLAGKTVVLRAPVFTYRGQLELRLTRPEQLEIR